MTRKFAPAFRSSPRARAAVAACMIGLAAASTGGAAEVPLDPAKLTNLVRQDCGGCHGLTLKGGLGKPLTAEHLAAWDDEQLTYIILNGVPGTPMPPWGPLLTESEARWIAHAIKRGNLR